MIYNEIDIKCAHTTGFWFGYSTGAASMGLLTWLGVWYLEGTGHLMVDWFWTR